MSEIGRMMPTTLSLPDLIREAADRSGLPDESCKQLYAVALGLEHITPRVVRRIQREWEDQLDAADSMDTSPHAEAHEFRRAADALLSILTDEQRAEVAALADAE